MTKAYNFANGNAVETTRNAAQALLAMNPAYAPQMKHFQQAQSRVLEEASQFASAWMQRRHDASVAAVKTASQIAGSGIANPAETMQAMTDWHMRSLALLAEDAQDYTGMLTRCAQTVMANELDAAGETAANAEEAAKPTYALPL